MNRCLIGCTGFVGGNLLAQSGFEATYHSATIDAIKGRHFDEIYCAGVSAVKWHANKFPDQDRHGIDHLLRNLETVTADRFVLVSTIDVYQSPVGVDEDTPIELNGLHPYGTHRRLVEEFVADRFPVHHIVRLPGLFGSGLKKNVIYDFLHANEVEKIHADAVFQFYPLDRIYQDIQTVIANRRPLVNFGTEPVSVREVAAQAFGLAFDNRPFENPPRYDMRTRHGQIFGSHRPYLLSRQEVLDRIAEFVQRSRKGERR